VQDQETKKKSCSQDPPLQARCAQKQVENPHQLEAEKVETAPETLQKPRVPQTLPQAHEKDPQDQLPLVEKACAQVPFAPEEVQEPEMQETRSQTYPQVQEIRQEKQAQTHFH
jgi:hypothetical protein